ncbi:MAG: hypothetical protein Kow0088_19390 [Anaerolineales bacterium]
MKLRSGFGMGLIIIGILLGSALLIQPVSMVIKAIGIVLLLFSASATLLLTKSVSKQERYLQQLEKRIRTFEEQTCAKYENVLRISHQFATATDESQIMNWALNLMVDVVNAKAATFTPIDELGGTLNTRVSGELPTSVSREWLEYLSSPFVRKKCPNCSNKEEQIGDLCPLIAVGNDRLNIYCVPIRRADQELGIFHLFLEADIQIDEEQQYLLRLISDQTALALEGARLRSRETNAHWQLEAVKHQLDVGYFIEELLKGLIRGLAIQTALVSVWDGRLKKPIKEFSVGELSEAQKNQLLSLLSQRNLAKLDRERSEISLESNGRQTVISLITLPIPLAKRDLIAALQLLLPEQQELTKKQEEMLKVIATQISFLLQNANMLAEVELKAILQERIRLAREIHDGLAQTLGFLKLKISQLRGYLEQGEIERVKQTTQLLHEAISDAYIDARHAIDQLRISVYDAPLAELLQETLDEFRESSGIPCELDISPSELRLPVEINVQLVRIVQESLSNVRKHAHAYHVQIQASLMGDWMILEVRDDGVGFQPQEVSRHSQYGLRGMKERAELIGAELQIISQPDQGATVQVRLPLTQVERSWQS